MRTEKIEIGSNRSFGIVFFFVFLIIAFYPLLNEKPINALPLGISIVFLILGLFNSKILNPLNVIWFKFGLLLGRIISPLVMGIIFFVIVTPIGIFMRLIKKDLLNLKFNNNKTYWSKKTGPKSKMKNQF
tara:strand:- start:152 stop:541 length:390 start_codon:yes stop_codon:yes gene_type:complete